MPAEPMAPPRPVPAAFGAPRPPPSGSGEHLAGRDPAANGLIARVRELAHLDHILWRARRGNGSVVALRGEPGVGKSALIEATVARANDFAVVQLRGTSMASAAGSPREVPGPVARLLALDPAHQDGQDRPAAASSPPGFGDRPGVGQPTDAVSPAVVDAAVETLRSLLAGASSPLLIALDDCHLFPAWFPGALALAVSGPLAAQPVALVVAWRDTPHMPAFDLGPVAGVAEHRLEGLSLDQAGDLFGQQHLETPAAPVLAALVGATAGNPYALLDAWHRLEPDQLHGWRPLPEPVPIGDAVAAAFGVVVEQLPDDVRRATAVAAAGRVPVDVLELVLDELDLSTDALVPAEDAGVLVVRGNRLDFLHPLVRAASFRLAPAAFRAEIHQATARAFARSGQVERSAFHASQNVTAPDDALTRLYGQAARVALDRGDPDAAARHEEMASAAAETSDTRAHHLSRASALWLSVGQTQRALVCLDRAQELHPSGAILAEVLYGRARARANHGVGVGVTDDMVSAAALCESDAPQRAVLMLADAAACRSLQGVDFDGAELAERAVALANAVSSHAESLALAALGAVSALDGRPRTAHRPDLRSATAMVIGQTQRFSASPHLAYLIGMGLLLEEQREQAVRWAQWIERCSQTVGDRALSVVPPLLHAAVALRDGRLSQALDAAEAAADRAVFCENQTLAARALAVMVEGHAARGAYEAAFEQASRVFALTTDTGREPRLATLASLAVLELQRGRPASAFAWLRAAEDDRPGAEGADGATGPEVVHDPVWARWAPAVAEVLVLGRRGSSPEVAVEAGAAVVERAAQVGAVAPPWAPWARGLVAPAIDAASEQFELALTSVHASPLVAARLELLWGVRLADAGRSDEARVRLRSAGEQFVVREADGWALLVDQEIERLPAGPQPDDAADPEVRWYPGATEPPVVTGRRRTDGPGVPEGDTRPVAGWEVCLLGSFAVRRHGKDVSLPLSLAAQGLKIVALRERIPVEELVELLWEDAEPGVGTRRLRNVLWRVRAACGDLLQRDGNFIRLAPGAHTDVAYFRRLAEQALGRSPSDGDRLAQARQALELYRGELLPGDRYADWATASRESLARLHLQLLDLLLADALGRDHRQEALGLLDRLIEADPYDEHYYLQAAELHAQAGNRRRAMSIIGRAERMLADLGVTPSPALSRVRNSLGAP
ncbi:MAG TPA: BTAD domain-containing putative transcriptional regulator [Acidimicrobiales bacterium]